MCSQPQLIAGRFRIADPDHDLLGQGGMGVVYKATDTESDAWVVVKALRAEATDNPDLVRRFEREGQALRQLNHPNIVKMLTAVGLCAMSEMMPPAPQSRWHADLAGQYVAAAAATLPPEIASPAAKERGRARDLRETALELLAELTD